MVRRNAALAALLATAARAQNCDTCALDSFPVRDCEAGGCEHCAAPGCAAFVRGECKEHPPHGGVGANCAGYACTADCPEGYTATGEQHFACTQAMQSVQPSLSSSRAFVSGRRRRRGAPFRWSAGMLTCTLSQCRARDMRLPTNAAWEAGSACADRPPSGFFANGTRCVAQCKAGYYASSGDAERTCRQHGPDGDMRWSGEPMICTKHGTCPRTTTGGHGYWLPGCSFRCDEKCTVRCNAGYLRPWENGKPTSALREYSCDCSGVRGNWTYDGKNWAQTARCLGCTDSHTRPVQCDCDAPPAQDAINARGMAGERREASCREGYSRVAGSRAEYTCSNHTGAWVGGALKCVKSADVPHSRSTARGWDWVCMIATTLGALSIPLVIKRYLARLSSHDVHVPPGQDAVGWIGLFMFVNGVLDLCADCYLCLTLISCGKIWLSCSAVTTFLLSTATTLYLGFNALMLMEQESL